MSTENNFVAGTTMVPVTPAQYKLLQFCKHIEAPELAQDIKSIHELGTYFVNHVDLVDLKASLQVSWLHDIIQEIAQEKLNTNRKTA